MSIKDQSYEKFCHPMMLTRKKKIEILELLFLYLSLFSMMVCYQGESQLKDRLLKRDKVKLVKFFSKTFFMMNLSLEKKTQYLRTVTSANKNLQNYCTLQFKQIQIVAEVPLYYRSNAIITKFQWLQYIKFTIIPMFPISPNVFLKIVFLDTKFRFSTFKKSLTITDFSK